MAGPAMQDAPASTPATAAQPREDTPDVDHYEGTPVFYDITAAQAALRTAWVLYLLLGSIPLVSTILMVMLLMFTGGPRDIGQAIEYEGMAWMIGGLLFLCIAVPVTFAIRHKLFSDYYEGRLVPPGAYLKGMLAIWIPLVIGGVIGAVGFGLGKEPASLFTSTLSFVLYLTMFPNGHAMSRPVGHHVDAAVHEEPR